jgi:hypothetical protein
MRELDGREMQVAGEVAGRLFEQIGLRATQPFSDRLPVRTLIYPIDYTMLSGAQFEALAGAAALEGDEEVYVIPYGSLEGGWGGTYDHRVIRLEFDDYRPDEELILEHLIYPSEASWGVVTSHGDFAVAGGSKQFIHRLREELGSDESAMAISFLRDSEEIGKSGVNVDWVHRLVAHIFGDARARKLSAQAGPAELSET